MRVATTITASSNRLTVGELREFVDQTIHLNENTTVNVTQSDGGQRDRATTTLTIEMTQ